MTSALAHPLSARSRAGWLLAWALFWLLMLTVQVQDYQRDGGGHWWKPVLWEGSACLVATLMLAWLWRNAPRHDGWLTQPARWFWLQLRWLPLFAPAFVTAIYALRHAVYALLGESYHHPAWGSVYLYESTKFALFFMLFTAIVFGVRTHAALAEQRLRTQEAQLAQLTQQLEPHFLFNALNTIASTIHDKPDLADSLLTRLAALLRATTDLTRRPSCTLDEELKLVDGYAAIMCERFADRVSLRVEVDAAARACRLPTLAIQPLLENAFRHGVERSSEPTPVDAARAAAWRPPARRGRTKPRRHRRSGSNGRRPGHLARAADGAARRSRAGGPRRPRGWRRDRVVRTAGAGMTATDRPPQRSNAPVATLRVLVVDDEAPARARLRRLLLAHPQIQVVAEARNGREALEQHAAHAPDALFLDVQMPEVDGLSVAASLPDPAPAIVFVTAFDHYALPAFDAAALDYLLKPADAEHVARAVQRLLARGPRAPVAARPAPSQLVIPDRGRTWRSR